MTKRSPLHVWQRLLATVLSSTALAGAAGAQWSTDPAQNLALADRPADQVIPLVAGTSDGGMYVAWFDNSGGSFAVYLQRLDRDGVEQFPHDGLLISNQPQDTALFGWDLTTDSSDHAVIVFSDTRNGAGLDVFAYRIAPDGTFVWGPNGIELSNNPDFEPAPRVAENSNGDLVFVWARLPSGSDGDLRMQRVTPAGAVQLAAGGVAIAGAVGESPGFAELVASTGGDMIVSWVRDISTFASPRHVRAERFDDTGASVWGAPVAVYDALSVPIAHTPHILADGAGGAVIVWHRSQSNLFNVLVQRLNAAGVEQYAHNGLAASADLTRHHLDPAPVLDAATGDVIVFWNERNSSQSMRGIFGQRLSVAGTALWGPNGKELAPVDAVEKSFPTAGAVVDGAVAVWTEGGFGSHTLLAQRVDANGDPVWSGPTAVLSSVASSKSRRPVSVDVCGVVRVAWEDDRNGTQDVFAQNVNPDGSLGVYQPEFYCTGKTNSLGCVPFLTTAGIPSATCTLPFPVTGRDMLPNEAGFLLYSFKKSNLNFHGGKLCVKAPVVRLLPPKGAGSSGTPPCSGRLNRNFNNRIQSGVDPQLTAGQLVHAQWRQRDPADPAGFGDSLTDGVRFTIQP